MKKIMLSAAIAGAMLAAGAPALAQPMAGWNGTAFWRGAPGGAWERIEFLQRRIDRGVADGSLNRREAERARIELRSIRREAFELRRHDGGRLTPGDATTLQTRLDDLSRRIRWLRHNGW